MRILLLGKSGQVGWELNRSLLPLGEVHALDYPEADFSKPETLPPLVMGFRPDVIVNAAAYTSVDKAETEEKLAMRVNADAVCELARAAKQLDSLLIHYSTDYVFDGTKQAHYTEEDLPNPRNVYGLSKLAGDNAIQESGCNHMIFRTSWVYAARGNNFLLTMLRLAKERDSLNIVSDQIGAPTWSRLIAEATTLALSRALQDEEGPHRYAGLYNLTTAGETSWHGFAEAIFSWASVNGICRRPSVSAILTSAYPTPAQRPLNSRLSGQKLFDVFSLKMPSWQQALHLCMQSLTQKEQQ